MDIMLDLETLSTAPDAAIVAIGACAFDESTCEEKAKFYVIVDPETAQRDGGRVSADTIAWWMRQGDAARSIFAEDASKVDIAWALCLFHQWLQNWEKPRIWGNGSDFDNVVLGNAYQRTGSAIPWSHKQNRCYRTLKNLRPDILIEAHGTFHNALDDAIAQARHAKAILQAMGA